MKIVVLGAGGYHPSRRRHTTCLMLPERGIVLDAGTGAFRIAQHLVTDRLDLFLTHAHLDHVFGLTFLLGIIKGDEADQFRVHGQPEKLAAVREHLYASDLFPVEPNWTPAPLPSLEGTMPLDGGGSVAWFPLEHPGGAIGYRFDGLDSANPEKSFAFVTDTTASDQTSYEQHLQGVDLLIHEAYFEDARHDFAVHTGHSCVGDVARLAARVGAGRLVLTHMNPRADDKEPFSLAGAKQTFAEIEFAEDEMEIEL